MLERNKKFRNHYYKGREHLSSQDLPTNVKRDTVKEVMKYILV